MANFNQAPAAQLSQAFGMDAGPPLALGSLMAAVVIHQPDTCQTDGTLLISGATYRLAPAAGSPAPAAAPLASGQLYPCGCWP